MLQKEAKLNLINKLKYLVRSTRYGWRTPSEKFVTKDGHEYLKHFNKHLMDQMDNVAWGEASSIRPKGLSSRFNNKPLCNMFLSYGGHKVNPKNNPFKNYLRGDYLSAKDIDDVLKNPELMKKKGIFKGQVIPVDRSVAEEIPGVIISRAHKKKDLAAQIVNHVGMSTGNKKAISAAGEKALHNSFGFRASDLANPEFEHRYGLILPEGVDVTDIINKIKTKGLN